MLLFALQQEVSADLLVASCAAQLRQMDPQVVLQTETAAAVTATMGPTGGRIRLLQGGSPQHCSQPCQCLTLSRCEAPCHHCTGMQNVHLQLPLHQLLAAAGLWEGHWV